MTQAALAEAVGVSTVAVNRIENGSLRLRQPLALRVALATGISGRELMRGKTGRLLDQYGCPYTAATFDQWRKSGFGKVSEAFAAPEAANLKWWIEVLLRAAARKHGGKSYGSVRDSLIQAIDAICTDFNLGQVIDGVLREYSPRVPWCPGAYTPDEERENEVAKIEAMHPGLDKATKQDLLEEHMSSLFAERTVEGWVMEADPFRNEIPPKSERAERRSPAKPARRSAGRKRRA